MAFGRGAFSYGLHPLSRASTYRLTVLGSCPVSSAADQNVFVRSYASRMSMISLSDFVTGPLRPVAHAWKHSGSHADRTPFAEKVLAHS
jgi:hypothetical protein